MMAQNGSASSDSLHSFKSWKVASPSPQAVERKNVLLLEATSLIRTFDNAHSNACASAIDAARDIEDARKNARAAREIAHRYSNMNNSKVSRVSLPGLSVLLNGTDKHEFGDTSPPSRPSQPPSPPKRKLNLESVSDVGREKRVPQLSSTSDRQTQRNVEELVQATLELENVKESLELEQMAHDETKSALTQCKVKIKQLETQSETLLSQMETSRESFGRQIDDLERELADARVRMQAAEEDAEVALDLAQQNTESRQHMEGLLAKAYQQVEDLKTQLVAKEAEIRLAKISHPLPALLPPRHPPPPPTSSRSIQTIGDDRRIEKKHTTKMVRFADSLSVVTDSKIEETVLTPTARSPQSAVTSGRRLLQRSMAGGGSGGDSPPSISSTESLLESANKHRQRLQDRLRNFNSFTDDKSSSPLSIPSSVTFSPQHTPGWSSELIDTCKNAALTIRESGKRLHLSGLWWHDQKISKTNIDTHLDTLARHYCTAVEVLLDKKQKEIVELESLCTLWERGSSISSNNSNV